MSLCVTPAALNKVWQLMLLEGDRSLKLRAYISGGGCQGFQYGFAFEFEKADDDWELQLPAPGPDSAVHVFMNRLSDYCAAKRPGELSADLQMVSVLVDPISLQYLRDAEIDYVADGYGERFVVHNPNAKTTCGCARSFSPAAA